MDDTYFYDPRQGHGLPHDPFKAILAPRPIGWISTVDAEGRVNLAPYSFFNGFHTNPPVVAFGSEGRKDSLRNVEATGEFVCNFASRALAGAMNETCAPLPPGENEMIRAGLEAAPSSQVAPPRVALAPAALECKLLQVLQLRDVEGRLLDGFMAIGQVVGVHIRREYLRDGRFDTAAAQPVARCGYRGDYAEVTHLFEMLRPTA
ncbi:flavin reductase family protein [Roseomonas sp. KE0001]|uniref:flavin reductase family protein n=1 Tax=Roseomonas sp. KE0001 TaxID=2479201 RepID=UPI0018E03414|nr:flavin reductase family protein [Roseomonas sp. KE0001]MBI0434556.1 flavin reductase family protein [Roseomonas sp. KE0001]